MTRVTQAGLAEEAHRNPGTRVTHAGQRLGHDGEPDCTAPATSSRGTYICALTVAVRGSASPITRCSGYSCVVIPASRTSIRRLSGVGGAAGSAGTATATARSPRANAGRADHDDFTDAGSI